MSKDTTLRLNPPPPNPHVVVEGTWKLHFTCLRVCGNSNNFTCKRVYEWFYMFEGADLRPAHTISLH